MPQVDHQSTTRPKIKLSRLRDIGWSVWDPIGLLGSEQKWTDEECLQFVDEYDSYLLQAAGRLRRGESDRAVAEYLIQIESEYMGLGARKDTLLRAERVVESINADNDLWTCPS